jgi:hypothetical protein
MSVARSQSTSRIASVVSSGTQRLARLRVDSVGRLFGDFAGHEAQPPAVGSQPGVSFRADKKAFKVLAYPPPAAPFAMPVLVGLRAVTWWEFTTSATLSIECIIGVARLAASIYGRAILRAGRRVRLREVVVGRSR